MNAHTARRLHAEVRKQAILKARLAAWWRAERSICPPLPPIASLSDLLSIIAADRQDDTTTPKAH